MSQSEKKANSDVVYIPPKTDLRDRVVTGGSANSAYQKAIKAAEEAIEQLSGEFDDWLTVEVDRLDQSVAILKTNGWNDDDKDKLFTISHDIKGQATTLGYPVITEICDTLCHLLEKTPNYTHISLNVIEIFASSIRSIIQQCQRGSEDEKANAISQGLRQMAMKILTHEIAQASKAKQQKETT